MAQHPEAASQSRTQIEDAVANDLAQIEIDRASAQEDFKIANLSNLVAGYVNNLAEQLVFRGESQDNWRDEELLYTFDDILSPILDNQETNYRADEVAHDVFLPAERADKMTSQLAPISELQERTHALETPS